MPGKLRRKGKSRRKAVNADKVFNAFASGLLDILKSAPAATNGQNSTVKRNVGEGRSTSC